LDHPGLVWRESLGDGRYLFEIMGGVDLNQALATGVVIFDISGRATQRGWRGTIANTVDHPGHRQPLIELESKGCKAKGLSAFAMWDLPSFRLKGRRISGRALDDLAGAAVGLCVLSELVRTKAPVRFGLLLTRAEEVGFVGMLAAIGQDFLPPEALYINIECSSVVAGATQGAGPIVRVGDRLWAFDPRISGGLAAVAGELEIRKKPFYYQRKLMDGGACEATALMQAGFRTGAVALPLGNYHNMGTGRKLQAEHIHLDDALMLVRLLVHLAQGGIGDALQRSITKLDKMLAGRLDKYRPHLDNLKE
jgi:endoglucanase